MNEETKNDENQNVETVTEAVDENTQPVPEPAAAPSEVPSVDSPEVSSTPVNEEVVAPVQDLTPEPPQPVADVQQITPPGVENTAEVVPEEKPKKKGKKGLIICLVIILIAVCACGYFMMHIRDPKYVFETAIKDVRADLKVEDTLEKYKNKFKGEATLQLTSSNQEIKSLGLDKKQTITYGFDRSKKTLEAGISAKEKTGVVLFVKNNKPYMYLVSTGKTYSLGEAVDGLDEIFDSIDQVSSDDIIYLVDKALEIIDTKIDKKDLSKSSVTETINNKKVKLTKNTYTLNKAEKIEVATAILEGFKKDEKAKTIINKYYKMSGSNETIDNEKIDEKDFDDSPASISIYTSGLFNKFAGLSVYAEESETVYTYDDIAAPTQKAKTTKEEITYVKSGDNFVIRQTTDGKDEYSITGVKNGKTIDATLTSEDLTGTFKVRSFEKTNVDFDFTLTGKTTGDKTETVSGTITCTGTVDNLTAKVSVKYDKYDVTVNLTNKLTTDGEVANYTESTTQITENDLNTVMTELDGTYIGALYKLYSTLYSSVNTTGYNY